MGLTAVDTSLVVVGCHIYNFGSSDEYGLPGQIGGTVVAIESDLDSETGEMQRRFITAARVGKDARNDLGIRFDVILEHDVKQVQLMNTAWVRGLMKRMGQVISEAKGVFVTDHHKCIAALGELEAALNGRAR